MINLLMLFCVGKVAAAFAGENTRVFTAANLQMQKNKTKPSLTEGVLENLRVQFALTFCPEWIERKTVICAGKLLDVFQHKRR